MPETIAAQSNKFLDRLQAYLRGDVAPAPIAQLIGFKVSAVEPGRVTISFQPGPQHQNAVGTLHGGVFCDVADAAMGLAYATNLAEGESFTTLELKINFLKPVWNSPLTAEGKVVRQGQTIGLVECDMRDDRGSLVARASSTCMTLRGNMATGR